MIRIDACTFCGRPSQGHYKIHRDGVLNGEDGNPQVPLCDDCGSHQVPTLQEIWARISMRDDDGNEWGPTPDPCSPPPQGGAL